MRYLYRYCICCETYKKIEVDNRLYKDLKLFGLLHGESKVFTICKECMNRMKEGVDENERDD